MNKHLIYGATLITKYVWFARPKGRKNRKCIISNKPPKHLKKAPSEVQNITPIGKLTSMGYYATCLGVK